MKRIAALLLGCVGIYCAGCVPPLQQHPLTLVLPEIDCSQAPPPPHICLGYSTCADLGINLIQITVGPSHPVATSLLCQVPQIASALTFQVYYEPAQETYTIDANYMRNGSTIVTSAGPFGDDESQTPWLLSIH